MTSPLNPMRGVKDRVHTAAARGVSEGLEAIRMAAIPLTPLAETGFLRNRTEITPILIGRSDFSATLAFTMVYARYQHENYGANFTTPGTGAGFLSTAAEQNADRVRSIIANHIRSNL